MPSSTAWTRTGRGATAGSGASLGLPRGVPWSFWGGAQSRPGQPCPHGRRSQGTLVQPVWSQAGTDWDFLVLPPVGHLAALSRFREEEEDKMLEAMIKKKGEAARGTVAPLKAWKVGLALALHGWCVSRPSLFFARKAPCGTAGQPRARKAGPGLGAGLWVPRRPQGGLWLAVSPFPGCFALNCVFPLGICSRPWRSLWAQIAVPTRNKIMSGMVKRALDKESRDLGLI